MDEELGYISRIVLFLRVARSRLYQHPWSTSLKRASLGLTQHILECRGSGGRLESTLVRSFQGCALQLKSSRLGRDKIRFTFQINPWGTRRTQARSREADEGLKWLCRPEKLRA